jgi:phosphatidylserine/phosphatidylglycerophosphate/cardiolipin synthase-like enzyme
MEVLVNSRNQWLLIILIFQVSYGLALCQAFFTPQDDLTAIFINMIHAEQKSIHGAMYMFTDKKVAQALIDAQKRGVDIQIVIDQISMSSCGKGKFLKENGIAVYIHRTEEYNPYTMALMHHKFFIFGSNQDDKALLWTGSWNCTLRASKHNDENVILLDDLLIIKQYQDCFAMLLHRLS